MTRTTPHIRDEVPAIATADELSLAERLEASALKRKSHTLDQALAAQARLQVAEQVGPDSVFTAQSIAEMKEAVTTTRRRASLAFEEWCTLHVRTERLRHALAQRPSVSKTPAVSESKFPPTTKYCFETLVTGNSNAYASHIGKLVAEKPGQVCNPLFIHGETGLGKTHLMRAIGHAIQSEHPGFVVRYVHAEDYFGEVVQAFQTKTFEAFKRTYRTVDVLLLDDFDFFDQKPRSQEEFYYALIHLIENRKQVIVTCKTCPEALSGFDERLLSRFVGGLVVPMEAPELALRVDILIQKAESVGITLTKAKAFHLARHLSANMYELEGAVNKLLAYVRFYNDPNGEAAVNAALTIMAGEIDDCEDEVAACIDQ